MDCCLLSSEEVGRLLHYKIIPDHDEHMHVPTSEAIRRLKDESYELVTGFNGRNYVTRAKLYYLRALPSGPTHIKVVQRIISNQLIEIKPSR